MNGDRFMKRDLSTRVCPGWLKTWMWCAGLAICSWALHVTAQVPAANQQAGPLSESDKARVPGRPVLFIIGDSTVHNTGPGLCGWGDVVHRHFDTNRIEIRNLARGGRSSRTFQTQGWWSNLLAVARPGDFLVIQFGHNDAGPLDDTNRARGTLPGVGDETKEIFNPITQQQEVVHTYGWYLRRYINDARAAGLTPILCSPVPRVPPHAVQPETIPTNNYVNWARAVSEQEKVHFVDLYGLIMRRYAGLAPDEIKRRYFSTNDNTHTSRAGAELNADAFAEGLSRLQDCPLKGFLIRRD